MTTSRAPRVAWVLGWAVPEAWFASFAQAAFPHAEHVFLAATPTLTTSLEAAPRFDRVIGYSLGALLLLRDPRGVSRHGPVDLLAPIFGFVREENLGGRIARTQVRYLTRWLQRDPIAALRDFYLRAGLSDIGRPATVASPAPAVALPNAGQLDSASLPVATPSETRGAPGSDAAAGSAALLPVSLPDLVWGLERLERDRVSPPLPAGWRAWCGGDDPLLDAAQLQALEPRIQIVPGATHHPAPLIAALAETPAMRPTATA